MKSTFFTRKDDIVDYFPSRSGYIGGESMRPDFTISLCGSSCSSLFCLTLSPLHCLSISWCPQSRMGDAKNSDKERNGERMRRKKIFYMNCITQK